ncbi:hypothetical protein EI555_003657, partial [Monodon monoceros]
RKDGSDERSKNRSKDMGATKESSEKDRDRDKTRKRRSASSGSSSTRSRSSSNCSSGSSTSTGSSRGSSSSSASSRSGSSSTSRSSSSGSSPGSPSPCRRRQDNRRRSRSKSKPPKRDEKERKRRSPSPKPTTVHIGRLTRNFENPDEPEKALKHMDGGHIDGQEITATALLDPWPQPPPPPPGDSALPGECRHRLPCGADEEGRVPLGAVPLPPPPQEPLQLQLLPIRRATEALPYEGGSVGKKSLTQRQASKVKAVPATFPLAAEFQLQECCWFGVVLIKMPSSFLARKLPQFLR